MAELNTANRTWSGENNSACGSEICRQPAKTLGVHHGHSPRANELARNCTCGKNCDLASHGMVTVPESHGQVGSRNASAKIPMVVNKETRVVATPAASDLGRSLGHRDVTSPSAGTGGSLPGRITWTHSLYRLVINIGVGQSIPGSAAPAIREYVAPDYTSRVSSKHLHSTIQTRFPFPQEWLPSRWIMPRPRPSMAMQASVPIPAFVPPCGTI